MNPSKSQPFVSLLVALASIFIIGWGIKSSAAILNPILLAAVITIVVLPMPQNLTKRGLPGWLSFVLTLLIVVGGLAAVVLLIGVSFANMGRDVSEQMPDLTQYSYLDISNTDFIAGIISSLGTSVAQIFIVMLVFIFMLSAALATPGFKQIGSGPTAVMSQITELTKDVRRYMSITTGVNLAVAFGNVILLWIVGVDNAVLWGLLAFVTGYIPTIGFWIALIPPVLIAYSTLGLQSAIIVFIGYVLINGSVQNIIQPRMMGQGLGISTLVVFVSLFVWGWLLGGVGAILSVPLTMIIMAVLYNFDTTRWIAVLMSAPKDEKSDDHRDALHKLQGVWQRAKHAVPDSVDRNGVAADDLQ